MDRIKRAAFLLTTACLIQAVVRAHLRLRDTKTPVEQRDTREGLRAPDNLRCEAGRDELQVADQPWRTRRQLPDRRQDKELRFPLETKHLVIRPFVPEDAKEIHKIYADLESMHRITSSPSKSLQDTYRLLARLTEHQQELGFSLWAMIEKESGRIIGDCGLFLVEGCWPEVEFTYHLDRPYWCKGYAKEATAECLRFGFEQLKFERIIAVLKPDDPVSAQMLDAMEKNGMSYMGTGWFHNQEMFIYAAFKQRLVLG